MHRAGTACIILLILLLTMASAEVYLVSPVEQHLATTETAELGRMQAGESLEITIADKTGSAAITKWTRASIARESLPLGWIAEDCNEGGKTLTVMITAPKDAKSNIYNFRIVTSNPEERIADEYIDARIIVEKGLLSAGISKVDPNAPLLVNEPVSYILTLENRSVAPHKILVDSTLSLDWFKPMEIVMEAKEAKEIKLEVIPMVYGNKDFKFLIQSKTNNSRIEEFNASLSVKPTLKSKYSAALYGFSFYTISLYPYYLINGFISLLIP